MTNVVQFPGKNATHWPIETSDMAEAFAMAALMCREWQDLTCEVQFGHVTMIGPDIYPAEPRITFAGRERTLSEIVADTGPYLQTIPLTPIARLAFTLWNTGGEDPVNTFADAIEWMENAIDFTRMDQEQPPKVITRTST